MVIDSLVAISASIITGYLNRLYGIQSVYYFAAFLCTISFLMVVLLVPQVYTDSSTTPKDKEVKEGLYVY